MDEVPATSYSIVYQRPENPSDTVPEPPKKNVLNKIKKIRIGAGLVFLLIFLITGISVILSRNAKKSEPAEVPQVDTSSEVSNTNNFEVEEEKLITITPPQSPTEEELYTLDRKIEYPTNWPREFTYPSEFTLIQADSGKYQNTNNYRFAFVNIFDGEIKDALSSLRKHLYQYGWTEATLEVSEDKTKLEVNRHNDKDIGTIIFYKYSNLKYATVFSTIILK